MVSQIFIMKNVHPEIPFLGRQITTQFSEKGKVLISSFLYPQSSIILIFADFVSIDKMDSFFIWCIPPQKISMKAINFITHTSRDFHCLHSVARNR